MSVLKQDFEKNFLANYLPYYQVGMTIVGYCKEGNTLQIQTFKVVGIQDDVVKLQHLTSENKDAFVNIPTNKNAVIYNNWSLYLFASVEDMMAFKQKLNELKHFELQLPVSSDRLLKALTKKKLNYLEEYHLKKDLNYLQDFIVKVKTAKHSHMNTPLDCFVSFEHIADLLVSLPVSEKQRDSLFNQFSDKRTRQDILNVEYTTKTFSHLTNPEPSLGYRSLAYELNDQLYIVEAVVEQKIDGQYDCIVSGFCNRNTDEVFKDQSLNELFAQGAVLDITHLPY